MGRYSGEEYEDVAPCPPSLHQFAMNGMCHVCRHSRDDLIATAKKTLQLLDPKALAR